MAKNYYEAQNFILDNIQIVDYISESVILKKKGAVYAGICPFHEEKTPSFFVSPSKGIWKCFGCGQGGNVIGFNMKNNSNSWKESIEEFSN